MCDNLVRRDSYSLMYVPDQFVTQEQLEIWHDDDECCTDDEVIEWYKRYKKQKPQRAKVKEELLAIAQHPDRVKDRCMSEDKKKETEKLLLSV